MEAAVAARSGYIVNQEWYAEAVWKAAPKTGESGNKCRQSIRAIIKFFKPDQGRSAGWDSTRML